MASPRTFAGARALVVGAGGLGCPASMALVRAGVGTLGLVDDDEVDLSNLHRQTLFDDGDVGASKVEVAARSLRALADASGLALNVEVHRTRLLPSNALDLTARYDIVLEGSDNFPTKFLAADAAMLARRPIIHAAAVRWHGTVLAVGPGGGPCYRCVFEDVPTGDVPNCSEAGVVGPMVGVVGAVQADLALSMLAGEPVCGTLVTFDGLGGSSRRRTVSARRACNLCENPSLIRDIEPTRYAPRSCDV